MAIQPRSYDCIVSDWLDHAVYGSEKRYNDRGFHGERIYAQGSRIFSYGSHFEMARVLYRGTGRKREAVGVLVNGERASVTTTKHQNILRQGILRHMSKLPMVIIPFGALDAAGIDLDSVRVLEAVPDRWLPVHHEKNRPPHSYRYAINETVYRTVEWTDEEVALGWQWRNAANWQEKLDNFLLRARALQVRIDEGQEKNTWERPLDEQLEHLQQAIAKHHQAGISDETNLYAYWGEKLEPTGDVITGWVDEYKMGRQASGFCDGIAVRGSREGVEVEYPDDDGIWRWTTQRHILGESLIEADVRTNIRVTCKQCDGSGIRSEQPSLPHSMGWIGEDDQEDWTDIAVRNKVMVPVPRTDVDVYQYPGQPDGRREALIAREYKQGRMWRRWTHINYGALPLTRDHYNCTNCLGSGRVGKQVMRRRVKFLSGFDHGEPHLAYFFCEMPKCDARTVDEAYEALKPDAVKLAEGMGREVKRQGDIFAIPTSLTTRELKAQAKLYGRRNGKPDAPDTWRNSMLLGTNHQGTEVIHAKDGTIYARGCMWHVPDGRTNDHVRVKLGKQWHIIVKNTVPVRRAR